MDIRKAREEYLRKSVLPMYKRKLFIRRAGALGIFGSWLGVYAYGKIVRILDRIEYEVYIK